MAIGRCAFWGLAFEGDPVTAAMWASWDASIDHAGEGVWAAAGAAAMTAATTGIVGRLEAGKAATPVDSRCRRALARVLQGHAAGETAAALHGRLAPDLGTVDAYDAALNFGYLCLALLYGGHDFEASLRLVAACGGATDQTALAIGAMLGAVAPIAEDWKAPLGEDATAALAEALAPFEGVETDAAPPRPAPEPLPDPLTSARMIGETQVSVRYVVPPVAEAGRALQLIFEAVRLGEGEVVLEPELILPAGWQCAHRLTGFRLRQGERSRFPFVIQPGPDWRPEQGGDPAVHIDGVAIPLALAPARTWYVVGPFVNHDGMGFDKAYRPEHSQRLGDVYNGRSDMAVRWREFPASGVRFDLEPLFMDGPGVVYLWARLGLPTGGPLRLVVATGMGAVVWLDGLRVLWYHEERQPIPRAIRPYLTEFVPSESTSILVKVMRGLNPIGPLWLYFLDNEGRVVPPIHAAPMDP